MIIEAPNLNYIKDLSGGDTEFEEKMISILKSELPEEVSAYKKSIENKDFKQSAEIVHKVKHKISILGLEKSYDFAVNHEKQLLSENANEHDDFMKLLTVMSNFLDTL
ncbi:Hpt domain-containing protein [Tenacibaculum sp. M341]|uniref:Hpt domain-containing protein n=1 Tax=Tenacibaculum sp. M341 TaxID=2530339 RepID=UPI0010497AB9|nr:Hpt domain-containing protein [Tenacibaculum sp. M341]TCI90349.1 Hpt domain-containing protein [Tenacibaculum sp. M341]